MFDSTQIKKGTGGYDRILFIGLMATLILAIAFSTAVAQTATPTPAFDNEGDWNGYKITATTEFGYRYRKLSGSENKYRSDLNYGRGVRVFDSNFYMQSESGKGKYFDSLLISNSGWGADPTGYTRVNMEKIGIYKFNGSVRKIAYFNNLSNHALGESTTNTTNTMGDFDLSILPQNDKLRFNFGASFGNYSGPGIHSVRWSSDEFPVNARWKQTSDDFRFGVDGILGGFNVGFLQGFRIYHEAVDFSTAGNVGNNPTNFGVIASQLRVFPTNGNAFYSQLSVHRTFEKKVEFTARVIYSEAKTRGAFTDSYTGRDNSNNFVDLDRFDINSKAKRPETRADVGLTYNVTDAFRISNTFTYDQFAITGDETLYEQVDRRNSAGLVPVTVVTNSAGYRNIAFKRYTNTVEADYQINRSIAFHVGYRYTHRAINQSGFDRSCSSTLPAICNTSLTLIAESESNGTNTFIGGMKIKPMKNWVIFWDIESGTADNVFTRLENYKFINFRVRSRITLDKFALNLSAITKDNNNPTQTIDLPVLNFGTIIKSRIYSGSVDWNPIEQISMNLGYTYRHQTSDTAIRVPIGLTLPAVGFSQYFVRDHYANFDISARPHKRVSFFGSFRIDRDLGQGNRFSALVQSPLTSYPMQMISPEFRVAFHLTRNVDWNFGWQYYGYQDAQTPSLNYKASLPFTSLRIYFGNGSADR